jgi:hypothetical protein
MNEPKITLQQAELNLEKALKHYTIADAALSDARSRETSALNAVNNAQKEFDEVVQTIKRQTPRSSDWHKTKGESV